MGVIIRINGLRFKTCDGIKLLDGGSTQTCQSPEDASFYLSHLCRLHCVHQVVLGLSSSCLQLVSHRLCTEGHYWRAYTHGFIVTTNRLLCSEVIVAHRYGRLA